MSPSAPPAQSKVTPPDAASAAPPDEEFWQKYSPHFEFPISTVATVALHVVAIAVIIYITTRLMKSDEKTPVPVRSVTVKDGALGESSGTEGAGGGEPKSEASDERPQEPQREIPKAELQREIVSASTWLLDLKENPEALKSIVKSPAFKKLNELNDDLKKRLAKGFTGKPGSGDGAKDGNPGAPGAGSGGKGDATSSGNRSSRYVIVFKTSNGEDYLKQLAAFEAKIVIPEPPDWSRNRLFENLTMPNQGKLLGSDDELPAMHFIDSDKESARKVAHALGLNYSPPRFVAFFPKKVEEELAAKERSYRNRSEDQIWETTFRVLERNGKYEIKVTDQIPKR